MDIDVSRARCDIGNMDVAYAIATGCINTSKVHMCLELGTIIQIYIYRHWWVCIFLVSTSVCSYDMDCKQVAHANTYAHGPHVLCICNGILSGLNVTRTLWLPLTLIIRNGIGNSNLPFLQKYVFFPAYFRVICSVTAQVPYCHNCLAVFLTG